jgi:hypothetical protein
MGHGGDHVESCSALYYYLSFFLVIPYLDRIGFGRYGGHGWMGLDWMDGYYDIP